jgi:ribosomal-protein-alanine N-acetyltransferase
MKVLAAELKDLSSICEIEELCFPDETAFPPGMFAYLIMYATALAAFDGSRMAGFIIGYTSRGIGFIYTLDVHPDYRKRGVGTMLIRALEDRLCSQGAVRVRLEAALDNPEAQALYRRAGYCEGGLIRDYYGRGRHAVRMWKELKK